MCMIFWLCHLTRDFLFWIFTRVQYFCDFNFYQCFVLGCKNLDSKVGVYACDPESYKVFKELLDPIICDYHRVKEVNHPKCDYGDVAKLNFRKLDEEGNYIISTRVRIGRCHKGFSFPPILTNVVIIKLVVLMFLRAHNTHWIVNNILIF